MFWQTFKNTNPNLETSLNNGRPVFEYEILTENTSFPLLLYLKDERVPLDVMKASFNELMKEEKILSAKKVENLKNAGYNIFNSFKTISNVGTKKNCAYWLLNTINSGGKQMEGCMVRGFDESCDCEACDLACYLELNNIFRLDFQTRKSWENLIGMELTFKLEEILYT